MRLLKMLVTGVLLAGAGCGYSVGYFAPVDPVSGSVPGNGIVQHLVPDRKSGVKVLMSPYRAQVALDDQGRKRVIAGLAVEVVNNGSGAVRVAAARARLKPAYDQARGPVRVERVGEKGGDELASGASASWRIDFDLGEPQVLEGLHDLTLTLPLVVGEKEETVSAAITRYNPNRRYYSSYNYGYAPYYPYYRSHNYYPYYSGSYGHYYGRRHGYYSYGHHGHHYGRRYGHYRQH